MLFVIGIVRAFGVVIDLAAIGCRMDLLPTNWATLKRWVWHQCVLLVLLSSQAA